jgi:hypothetical protein
MNPRQRKLILVGLPVLLLLVFVVGGWWRNPPAKVIDIRTNLPKDGKVTLGAEVSCVMRIQTSWRARPTGALRLDLAEGVSLAPDATIRLQTVGWGGIRWYVLVQVRAARPGPVPASVVHVPLRTPGQDVRLDMPAFTVTLPPVDNPDPESAPLPPPPPPARWLGWVIVLLVASFIWYWLRRQRRATKAAEPAASPSLSLHDRLEALRPRLASPDAALFGELCDLVAEHLQSSFRVPATGLTLREQAAWLSQAQALPARLVEPLVAFWRQAEAVRFAGQDATPEQAEAAFRATAALLAQGRRGGG